jgi:hypothetical protein
MIVTGETLSGTSNRGPVVRERLVLRGCEVASVRQIVAGALDKEMPTFAKCSESLQIDTAHFVLRKFEGPGTLKTIASFARYLVHVGAVAVRFGAYSLEEVGRWEPAYVDEEAVRL